MKQKTLEFLEAHKSKTPIKVARGGRMETGECLMASSFSDDCRKGAIADEARTYDSENTVTSSYFFIQYILCKDAR